MKFVLFLAAAVLFTSCNEIRKQNPITSISSNYKKIKDEKRSHPTLKARLSQPLGGAMDVYLSQKDGLVTGYTIFNRDLPSTGTSDAGSIGMILELQGEDISSVDGTNLLSSASISQYESPFDHKFVDNLGSNSLTFLNSKDINYFYKPENPIEDSNSYAFLCEGQTASNKTYKKGEQRTLFQFRSDPQFDGKWRIVTDSSMAPSTKCMGISYEAYESWTEQGLPYNQLVIK